MDCQIIIKVCCGATSYEFVDPDDDMTVRDLIDEANDICAEFDQYEELN